MNFEKKKVGKYILNHLVNLAVLVLAGVIISHYAVSKLSEQQNRGSMGRQIQALQELVRRQGKLFHSLESMGRKVEEPKEKATTPTEQVNNNPRDPASDNSYCSCSD